MSTQVRMTSNRFLHLDGHGDTEYYGAAGMEVCGAAIDMNNIQSYGATFTSGPGSRSNRSFIKKNKKHRNSKMQDQERSSDPAALQ